MNSMSSYDHNTPKEAVNTHNATIKTLMKSLLHICFVPGVQPKRDRQIGNDYVVEVVNDENSREVLITSGSQPVV